MANLTCPFPANLNPLSANGFQFAITKLPGLSYFCQAATIPSITLGEASQSSPLIDAFLPGEKLEYEPITIEFLIDEQMENFKAIQKWMTGLGFPDDNTQYSDLLAENENVIDEDAGVVSDGTLIILNSSNNPVATIQFKDLFPVSLGSLRFSSTSDQTEYLTGTATFRYTSYSF